METAAVETAAVEEAPRLGRRRSTTQGHIADVALELFATYGFSEVSVDDVAVAAGIARRTLFRYYPSKNAIPWGDFDSHLQHFAALLDNTDPGLPLRVALRAALLDFNTFDDSEAVRHRQRMRVILQTAELQAYSMTMYAGWRDVVARFVARRTDCSPTDLRPQTQAWMMLGVALAAYEHWLAAGDNADTRDGGDEDDTGGDSHGDAETLRQVLADAFDTAAIGL